MLKVTQFFQIEIDRESPLGKDREGEMYKKMLEIDIETPMQKSLFLSHT